MRSIVKDKKMRIKTHITEMHQSVFITPNIWVTWNYLYITVIFGWWKWTYDIDFYKK